MASITYPAPSTSLSINVSVRFARQIAILVASLALLSAGLVLATALGNSPAQRTQSLVPTPTQPAP